MKKFYFKFSSVLKFRKTKEGEALRMLAGAQKAYQEEINRKNQLLRTLDLAFARRERIGHQATAVTAFNLEHDFIVGTKQRIIQADHSIVRARRGVEKALRTYLYSRKQTKIIESLLEKELAAYKKEKNKAEQKAMDDLTIMRTRLKEEF